MSSKINPGLSKEIRDSVLFSVSGFTCQNERQYDQELDEVKIEVGISYSTR